MLCAKIRDHLGNLRVGERVAKGRHLLPAVEDLGAQAIRLPLLVATQIGKGRTLLAANAVRSMTTGAAAVAEEHSAGFGGGFVPGAPMGMSRSHREQDECGQQGREEEF